MADATLERSRLATVFGGSGFVGRHIVRALARRGWRVRVAVRRPDLAAFLQTSAASGRSSRSRRICAIRPRSPPRSRARRWSSTRRASRRKAGRRPIRPCMSTGRRRWRAPPAAAGVEAYRPRLRHWGRPGVGLALYRQQGTAARPRRSQAFPERDDPSSFGRLRAGGRLLQPIRRALALPARHSALWRRLDASAAGLRRATSREQRRGAGGRSQARDDLRARRPDGHDAARSRRTRPPHGRTSPPARRAASRPLAPYRLGDHVRQQRDARPLSRSS